MDVIKANSAQVASDLRQMIVGAFEENGIVIAFPQQDIHLDMARPLPVETAAGLRHIHTPRLNTGTKSTPPQASLGERFKDKQGASGAQP